MLRSKQHVVKALRWEWIDTLGGTNKYGGAHVSGKTHFPNC